MNYATMYISFHVKKLGWKPCLCLNTFYVESCTSYWLFNETYWFGSFFRELLFRSLSFSVAAEGVKYWQSAESKVFRGRDRWSRAKASDVELNSYALLIYLHRGLIIESQMIANWLMSQRNANGGFSSTQVCTVCTMLFTAHVSVFLA